MIKPCPEKQQDSNKKRPTTVHQERGDAFGIMSSVFRTARKPTILGPEKAHALSVHVCRPDYLLPTMLLMGHWTAC